MINQKALSKPWAIRLRLTNSTEVDNLIEKSENTPLHLRAAAMPSGYPGSLTFQPYLKKLFNSNFNTQIEALYFIAQNYPLKFTR